MIAKWQSLSEAIHFQNENLALFLTVLNGIVSQKRGVKRKEISPGSWKINEIQFLENALWRGCLLFNSITKLMKKWPRQAKGPFASQQRARVLLGW